MVADPLDPKLNHVTFHYRRGGKSRTLSGTGPAQAVDCVAALWAKLAPEAGLQPSEVYQIYSEWEPADEDLEFLDATFPEDAELAFTFQRPKGNNWKAALAAASKIIAESAK